MDKTELISRLKVIFNSVERYDSIEFRLLIEREIKMSGEEGIKLLIKLLSSNELNTDLKIQLIKIAGYLRDFKLLLTLKKLIDGSRNINVKKEVIIAVSKFNDRRALNILEAALKDIQNPLLMSVINNEIGRIKQNNPILALLPRFKKGGKNLKAFRNTVEILKKIVLPKDAIVFTKFLEYDEKIIRNGAYEILCFKGDLAVKGFLFNHFESEIKSIDDLYNTENDSLYQLVRYLKRYILRFEELIELQVDNLIDLFWKIKDLRVQKDIFTLITMSGNEIIVDFTKRVFQEETALRNDLIQRIRGNDLLFDFIFDVFKNSQKYSPISTRALMYYKRGREFLKKNIFNLDQACSAAIAENITEFDGEDSRILIDQIFKSDRYFLKETLLDKFRKDCTLNVKDYLFEKRNEKEFNFMGDRYYSTVSQLFPISFLKRTIENIVNEDFSKNKIEKLFSYMKDFLQREPVIRLGTKIPFEKFSEKIVLSNNKELILILLEILYKIKTFDLSTLKRLSSFKKIFISRRPNRITSRERTQLNKMNKNFTEIIKDISEMNKGTERINILSKSKEFNFDLLERILKENHNSYWSNYKLLANCLKPVFAGSDKDRLIIWAKIFKNYPRISLALEDEILEKLKDLNGVLRKEFKNIYTDIPKKSSIFVLLSNHLFKALIVDQIGEFFTDIEIVYKYEEFNENDILLIDPNHYEHLVLKGIDMPKRSILFLNKMAQVSGYRDFEGKIFVEPVVLKKIIIDILSNIII
jgi:hypothetical protein